MTIFGRQLIALALLAAACGEAHAEGVDICGVPPALPIDTMLGEYSPRICFHYDGLVGGKRYTMKVWVLVPGPWYCASTQWCERTFSLDNTDGRNSSGIVDVVENMDVYRYASFDWVVRLYDDEGTQVAFVERYVGGTDARAPVLAPIGARRIGVSQPYRLQVSASTSDGSGVRFSSPSLPEGSTLSADGLFQWTPTALDAVRVTFVATSDREDALEDAEAVTLTVAAFPRIDVQPVAQVVRSGTSVMLSVSASDAMPLSYRWQRDGIDIPGATSALLDLGKVGRRHAGRYRVFVSNGVDGIWSDEALLTVVQPVTSKRSVRESLSHLRDRLDQFHTRFPIYDDIGSAGNHFHARAKVPDEFADVTIDGSWADHPHSGATAIRCTFTPHGDNFGGFLFMNGYLVGAAPVPYFGEDVVPGTSIAVDDNTGINLSGATRLSFWARGERGNERLHFFMGGAGWSPDGKKPLTKFADSTGPFPDPRRTYRLSKRWRHFSFSLAGVRLNNVMNGFAWIAAASENSGEVVFYLDDLKYELGPARRTARLAEPHFVTSFETRARQPDLHDGIVDDDIDLVLRNTAFLYDNALAVLAFLSQPNARNLRHARIIGDAMVYAAQHDRSYGDGRLRTAYAAGDIALPPGWVVDGRTATVPVPGFYDEPQQRFFEVENRDVDTGNNAWAMIALAALYERTGDARYLDVAEAIGQFVTQFRSTAGTYPGFLGGIQAAESSSPIPRPYASTEHNLDLFAAFSTLARLTNDASWAELAEHAYRFVASMWDEERGCYLAGTTASPNERNAIPGQLPLDTQSWSVLALGERATHASDAIACAERNNATMADGFDGFDFNDDRDGTWFEGTGQMSVAYAHADRDTDADRYAATLRDAQQIVTGASKGGTVAASHDGVSSGFGFKLFARPHVGATAWNVFAQERYNPYYQAGARGSCAGSGCEGRTARHDAGGAARVREKRVKTATRLTPTTREGD